MKLSIITVNLNNRAGLEKTMESVLRQSFVSFEYLIIDGGSTDGSVDVVKERVDRLAYWVSEADRGVYHAMNKGIERATGEYLLFLNSGDFLCEADSLSHVSRYLQDIDIIYGNLKYDYGDRCWDSNYPDELTFSYLYTHYIPHPASFIKRDLLNAYGGYEEKYKLCADWVFFIKAICIHGARYFHLQKAITVYDTSGISAKSDSQPLIQQERKRLLSEEFPFLEKDLFELMELRDKFNKLKRSKAANWLNRLGWIDL
ncbi:glycosyltransferase family 2 protein [Parapedobacter sp. GCM10030251]|uniref:glycosyltransferase family 2 protein n=1 Tax=Parapedobacter sp. GCM10030251 TaxID=3273419 RepID=UPI003607B2EF